MTSSPGNTTQLQAILDKASEGDTDAYGELIAGAAERLLKLTRRMLRNYPHLRRWEQTDDVFQTAVMRLYRSLAQLRPESVRGFFGLATTQIRRTLIDLARHHFGPEGQGAKHETNVGSANSHGGIVENKPDTGDQPETLETWACFHEAVDALPADGKEVFQPLWYGGLPQKEIANLLGISVPTVQRRWYEAQLHVYKAMRGEQPPIEEGS